MVRKYECNISGETYYKEELYDKIIPAFITTTNDTKEFLISDDIHISNSELPNEIVTLVSNDVKLGIAIRVTGHLKPIINKKGEHVGHEYSCIDDPKITSIIAKEYEGKICSSYVFEKDKYPDFISKLENDVIEICRNMNDKVHSMDNNSKLSFQ